MSSYPINSFPTMSPMAKKKMTMMGVMSCFILARLTAYGSSAASRTHAATASVAATANDPITART